MMVLSVACGCCARENVSHLQLSFLHSLNKSMYRLSCTKRKAHRLLLEMATTFTRVNRVKAVISTFSYRLETPTRRLRLLLTVHTKCTVMRRRLEGAVVVSSFELENVKRIRTVRKRREIQANS